MQECLGLEPFSGAAFVFSAKRADRIKIVIWDGTGMVLVVYKRVDDDALERALDRMTPECLLGDNELECAIN